MEGNPYLKFWKKTERQGGGTPRKHAPTNGGMAAWKATLPAAAPASTADADADAEARARAIRGLTVVPGLAVVAGVAAVIVGIRTVVGARRRAASHRGLHGAVVF